MSTVTSPERKRIHPHKFTMWLALGSIIMMFAALTSAYIVKKEQSNWLLFPLPKIFWYSTLVILFSSLTMFLSAKAFKARDMVKYRTLITLTAVLGILFGALQWTGFTDLQLHGVKIFGVGSNASASFLGIIVGLHVVHVLGGVIALLVLFFRAFSNKQKIYSPVPVEIVSTYWHFVDILWIYLFIFLSFVNR
ncbi:cytochrome c oxidase subunit 3 [Danxiaibacter flavus]|uniref:Cytochrome c oxidase subunit 3 n=1 Tax=Danxiaibacter flavus TaxID=3049108 RepID=A0ABV3ZIR2_9BACT|nr:cytochrome c oxidase subunit 3 [Chitinophagaceae bacterium DXS]